MANRIIAKFHPQAWVNDNAIEVDPEGPTEWDVTDRIVAMSREKAIALEDDQNDTDYLAWDDNAPKWIQDWQGPFYVEVAEQIRKYFQAEESK